MGILHLQSAQLKRLAVAPRARLSPLLEKCCLRVCANDSYQNAQADLKALLGIEIGHSSLHRCVQRQDLAVSEPLEMIEAVSIDRGKERLRTQQKGQASNWRDYKAVRLNCTYFGTWFQDNASLSAWVNAQRLSQPLVCLGDGLSGHLESVQGHCHTPTASRNSRLVSQTRKICSRLVVHSSGLDKLKLCFGMVRWKQSLA